MVDSRTKAAIKITSQRPLSFSSWSWFPKKQNRKSTKLLHDVHKQTHSRSSEQKFNLNCKNRESWPLSQFSDLISGARSSWMKGRLRPLEKGPHYQKCTLFFCFFFSLSHLQWDLKLILKAYGRKGNNQNFQELLDPGSELRIIPRDPKYLCVPPVRDGAQREDQWSFSSGLSASFGPSYAQDPSVFSPPYSRMHNWIDKLSLWQNTTVVPWSVEWELFSCERKEKPVELSLPRKRGN